jgi:hypothetical protein
MLHAVSKMQKRNEGWFSPERCKSRYYMGQQATSLRLWVLEKDAELVSEELEAGLTAIPTHICKHCKLLLGDYSNKK